MVEVGIEGRCGADQKLTLRVLPENGWAFELSRFYI